MTVLGGRDGVEWGVMVEGRAVVVPAPSPFPDPPELPEPPDPPGLLELPVLEMHWSMQ